MKCQECESSGQRSKVFSDGYSLVTAMGGGESFWDEDGVRHRHDPNTSTTGFSCSAGHRWSTRRKSPCPAEGCDYGRELD
jgi:hypothetical protein